MPSFLALNNASVRLLASNFEKRFDMWVFTVGTEIYRASAICLLDFPLFICNKTSGSRPVIPNLLAATSSMHTSLPLLEKVVKLLKFV